MSRRADGRKVSEWRVRFERFQRAGLSVVRFCGSTGLLGAGDMMAQPARVNFA